MAGSNGKLSIGMGCFVGAIVLVAWAAPSSCADGELHAALAGNPAKAVVVAALPVGRGVAPSRDAGGAKGGKPPATAYRRILRRIAATRNNWAPMPETPRLAAMTPVAPNTVLSARKQVTMPAHAAEPHEVRTALGY